MTHAKLLKFFALALVMGVLLGSSGCAGVTTYFLWLFRGDNIDAEFTGLEGKRVAVICVSDSSAYGADSSTEMLARLISVKLRKEVDDIEVVREQEIHEWIDHNDWDDIDFTAIGRGVGAEMVVAVELASYRLDKGRTLYQGQCDLSTSVFDLNEGGDLVFFKKITGYEFPKVGGRPTTDTSRAKFESIFLVQLSHEVCNYFYDHPFIETIANDAKGI